MTVKVTFLPQKTVADATENTKILQVALKASVGIRFGCGACRCGTCGIAVNPAAVLSVMKDNERELLSRMGLPLDGSVRLACQARVLKDDVEVDLDFQDKYSPDSGLD